MRNLIFGLVSFAFLAAVLPVTAQAAPHHHHHHKAHKVVHHRHHPAPHS